MMGESLKNKITQLKAKSPFRTGDKAKSQTPRQSGHAVKCLDSRMVFRSKMEAVKAVGKKQKNGLGKAFRLAEKAGREPLIAVFAGRLWTYADDDAANLSFEEAFRIVIGWKDSKMPQYKDQLAQRHIYPDEYWPELADDPTHERDE